MDDEAATIAGHRLVRAVRRDAEREVWVAADAAGDGVELHRSLPGGEAALAREAEALLAAGHPHLVPILDVAVDAGVVLVRPLVPHDLAAWLVHRLAPAPGEAVTALAPVAAALGALHAAGASAGGCGAADIRLEGDGAPLLLGAGARIETARPTEAWRAASEGVTTDLAGWRALAVAVLDAAGVALPAEVDAALELHDASAAGEALLRAWPALPLELEPAEAPAPAVRARSRERERATGADAIWAAAALLAERLVARAPATATILRRGSSVLRRVRPRFWAVAGGGAAALVAAAALLWPTGAADARDPGAATASHIATVAAPSQPDAGATEPEASPSAVAEPSPSPGGDAHDVLEAATALLAERESCIDAGDASCLVALHEPDSPQLTAARPWRLPDDGELELAQRLGDAWLLRVRSERAPASVLVMSTEAGWTLRDAWSD